MFGGIFKSRFIATAYEFYCKCHFTAYRNILANRRKAIASNKWKSIEIPVMMGFSWSFKKSSSEEAPKEESNNKKIGDKLKEADQLFDNGQFSECCDLLKNLNPEVKTDVEVLWRLSRALYQMASKPDVDGKVKKQLANEAYETITRAMEINDNHFAVHKWMAVILDVKSSCEGTKERIKNIEVVKTYMMRAVELNPGDATTLYMLGEWCYGVADLPWYQRKIAKALFAEPPVSSYEEAISYFLKAEVVEPNFYSKNLLMLGKSYLKLQKLDLAKYYLHLALLYPARTNDDHQANKEARDILKNLK